VHDVVRHLRRVTEEFPDRVLVGEAYVPVEELALYLGGGRDDEFHLAFNFEPLGSPFTHRDLTLAIERSEALHPPGTLPTYAFGNHDKPRQATRWGEGRAALAAFMLMMLRGVAVMYASEEIGMIDADSAVLPEPPFDRAGRDAARTPMQWSSEPGAGFSTGTPWLPVVDAASRNVAAQSTDPASILNLYRRLITARHASPALTRGEHRSFFGVAPDVLAWVRESEEERVLCVMNVAAEARTCDLAAVMRRTGASSGTLLVATSGRNGTVSLEALKLDGLEGLAISL
jgi:alpha-glucosidase